MLLPQQKPRKRTKPSLHVSRCLARIPHDMLRFAEGAKVEITFAHKTLARRILRLEAIQLAAERGDRLTHGDLPPPELDQPANEHITNVVRLIHKCGEQGRTTSGRDWGGVRNQLGGCSVVRRITIDDCCHKRKEGVVIPPVRLRGDLSWPE